MDRNSIKYQIKVEGRERKEVARLIANYFGTHPAYQGAPRFDYLITDATNREWRVDKTGAIITQGSTDEHFAKMFSVLTALDENGVVAIGQAEITLATEGHNGVTLRNLVNILAAKEHLIAKAVGISGQKIIARETVDEINAVRLRTVEDFLEAAGSEASPGLVITKDTITFRWFAATLNPEAIQAYSQFALAINAMAMAQKHSSPLARENSTKSTPSDAGFFDSALSVGHMRRPAQHFWLNFPAMRPF